MCDKSSYYVFDRKGSPVDQRRAKLVFSNIKLIELVEEAFDYPGKKDTVHHRQFFKGNKGPSGRGIFHG